MPRKIAIKRLNASDLSFFESYFRAHPDVKQKAFNLDAQVLVGNLYPSLPEAVETLSNKRIPLDLYFFGPGFNGEHNLQRKILKQEKNWRLNGELVHGPEDFPKRYDELRPGDFALIEFSGTPVPTSAKVVLLAAGNQSDATIHGALATRFHDISMVVPADADIEAVIDAAEPADGHPILDWSDQNLVEDVALGGTRSVERLEKRRRGRGISPEDFQRSKSAAEMIGALGEELVNAFLMRLVTTGELRSCEWISSSNAIAPYDFKVVPWDGPSRLIDAKSTSSGFLNPIHISLGELLVATEGDQPYDVYRVFKVTESSAILRVAKNVGPALRPVQEGLGALPNGVVADSLSINPNILPFDAAEIAVYLPEEDAENN